MDVDKQMMRKLIILGALLSAIPELGKLVFSAIVFVMSAYSMCYMYYNMSPSFWKDVRKSKLRIVKILPDLENIIGEKKFNFRAFCFLTILAISSLFIQLISRCLFNLL